MCADFPNILEGLKYLYLLFDIFVAWVTFVCRKHYIYDTATFIYFQLEIGYLY